MKTLERLIWMDWLRVTACIMVMIVHSTEPFYLGGKGSLILTEADAFWSAFFDSLVRACVPLFIVVSSYLQFPSNYSSGKFLRRRTIRILIPFLLWSIIYALVWGEPIQNFKDLLLNFNYASGHLWFVYMLVGVYLLIPLLSPWAEKVSKQELQIYLLIWLFTTLIPIIRDWASNASLPLIYGSSDIPRQALYPLWGECSWNTYGVFYYISGFIGYLLLGLYFRKFVGSLSWKKTLLIALPCYLTGFAITFGGFYQRVLDSANGIYPVEGSIEKAIWWETTWNYDTLGIVLMTIGWILLFRKIKFDGSFYQRILLPISKASYGIYLAHLLILVPICGVIREWMGIGTEGVLGFWTTPIEIILSTISAFVVTAILSVLLQQIPKIGKYIIG
ncbi:MAG: acyltransferase [Mediterranea massiliensis]|nr:acyltransferase [Mediterranea massiliensis]